jgi:beta-glucosidase/6-phospho-beta-glucosidase/beta-galactosidase
MASFGSPGARFMIATGIENSYPVISMPDGTSKRVDSMIKSGHDRRWREDFELVRQLGLEHLRYGPAYYRVHVGPGRYDWSMVDEPMAALEDLRIEVIADLCHFGIPDWLGDFQNPDFPPQFAEYARAFARRYPQVRLFTPVNEIFITARFSAQHGWWNERLRSDRAFVTAVKHLARANVLAMRAILEVQPEAVFVQSESIECFHAEEPAALPHARLLNGKRFLGLDLTYGRPLSPGMRQHLLEHGCTADEQRWFEEHRVEATHILGVDYYETCEHHVASDGGVSMAGSVLGLYVLARQYHARYQIPLMHTETNMAEPRSVAWLQRQWTNMMRLKADGVPVLGFTWYSLTDQVDWCTSLREDAGRVNALGLYDIERKLRSTGLAYRDLARRWSSMLSLEGAGLAQAVGY